MEMLQGFLRPQEIDILFLQEVAHPNLNELLNYKTYNNVGDRLCGLVVRVSGYRYRSLGFDSRRYQIF